MKVLFMVVFAVCVIGCTGGAIKSKTMMPNYETVPSHSAEISPLIFLNIGQRGQKLEGYSLALPHSTNGEKDAAEHFYFKPLYIVVN